MNLIMPPSSIDYSAQITTPINIEYSPNGIGAAIVKSVAHPKSQVVQTTTKKARNTIKKIFIPSDLGMFKQNLVLSRKAEIELTYRDGTKKIVQWDASNFTAASDLLNNVSSKLGHRSDKDDIVQAVFKVI